MALYGGRTGNQLKISDALTTGYKFLLKPAFVIPILVIGLIVNLIVTIAFVPVITGIVLGNSEPDSTAMMGALIAAAVGAIIAGSIGGVILNLYGQVWAAMASSGEPPTMQQAFARVSTRWISVLGAGLIVAAISLGGILVLGIVSAALGGLGLLVAIVGAVAFIYVALRLSMAGWLAAEGASAMDAVRGSWEITKGDLLVILGWSIVIGIVLMIITTVAGIVLNLIPLVGAALTQTIATGFGFGASVTLFRRIQA